MMTMTEEEKRVSGLESKRKWWTKKSATDERFLLARRERYHCDLAYKESILAKSRVAYYLKTYPECSLQIIFAPEK